MGTNRFPGIHAHLPIKVGDMSEDVICHGLFYVFNYILYRSSC